MHARGLSTRDIEALFADEAGKPLLSRTAVSEITERLWAEYEAFASRSLSEFEVSYLFIDGIAERLHLGQPRDAAVKPEDKLVHSCRHEFLEASKRGYPNLGRGLIIPEVIRDRGFGRFPSGVRLSG